MKSKLLRTLNAKLPIPIRRLIGPIIRRRFFANSTFAACMNELREMDSLSPEERKKRQFAKLKATLIHAYENTPYYPHVFDDCGFNPYEFSDFSEMSIIPRLKKADINTFFDQLKAVDITDAHISMSGGSSGVSTKMLLAKDSVYKERAFIYHFWGKHGYDYRTSRIASFRGGIDFKGKIRRFNPLYNEIQLDPCQINAQNISKYLRYIDAFQADFLHGHPSAVYAFCKFAHDAGATLKGKYKAVFFISENIYDYQRAFIEETLGCQTWAYLGHTERAVFAEQSEAGGYLFNDFYCYAEDIGERERNIITTGLINPAMPLIRYELDDSAVLDPATNTYQITGHRDGFLYGKMGEIISAATLYVHTTVMDKVSRLQFVQEEKGKALLRIAPIKEPITEKERQAIEDFYQEKLGSSIQISVEVTSELYFTSRGKQPLIVQKILQES